MTFTNLEKYEYSKKCLKQQRQPPTPPFSKVEGIFAPKIHLARLRLLFAIEYAYPADRVTKRFVCHSP